MSDHPSVPSGQGLKTLRFIVLSLGIALAVGFVMLFAVLAVKLQKPKAAACAPVSPDLPVYTDFRLIEQQGAITALWLEGDGLTHIVRVDNCSGRIVSHVKLGRQSIPLAMQK